MYYFYALLIITASYLSGSINYAIIISRIIAGKEIRDIGNLNPGTMNVFRSIGKKWGIIVGFLDSLKSFVPMLLAKLYLFKGDTAVDSFTILLIGMAAVAGHCWPVFYKFNGGRGVGPIIGLFLIFVPAEFLVSIILAILVVAIFFRNVEFRWGRWVPMMFITITPFLTLGLNFFVDIPWFADISLGGHPWYILVCAFCVSFYMLFINFAFMGNRVDEYKGSVKE